MEPESPPATSASVSSSTVTEMTTSAVGATFSETLRVCAAAPSVT